MSSVMDFMNDDYEEEIVEEQSSKPTEQHTVTTEIGPFIPKHDNGYIEFEEIAIQGQNPIKAQFHVPAKPKLEHEIEMWDEINKFENEAWSPKNVGLRSGFKSIDDAFDGGIKPGFIVVGGDSNLGKSGFISQMAWQISDLNDDAYVMDFSLDDPMPDKLARVIGSGNKVLLNAVKTPGSYANLPLMLVRRKEGLNKLRARADRYRAYDANFSTYCEEIEEEIQKVIINLEAAGIEKKIVVMIDNMHDLNLRDKPNLLDKQKYDVIAQWCSDTAIKYNISVIASAELKKLNGTRRPALDDIREAVKIKYEAKAVLLVYNEVHYKGESSEVYFNRVNTPLRQPIFEVHVAKNKFHTYKGRMFFEFYPEMARFEEPDLQSIKHYASVIFGS